MTNLAARLCGEAQAGQVLVLDFADALHHASSRGCEALLTFDEHRFAGKARRLAITPPVRLAR